MTRWMLSAALALGAMTTMTTADHHQEDGHGHDHECALDFRMKDIDGETVDLEDYEGNVVLIVNVASRCGFTGQYAGLQSLYEKYKDKGLVVIGFPCNQFGGQEPGSDSDVKQFCQTEYDVTFPMMSKIEVNGSDAAEIYRYLTKKDAAPKGDGDVSWNFEKFLIDRDGQLVARFNSRTAPNSSELVGKIEELL